MGMLPYVTGYRAGYKAAKAADGPGGSGYDAAYRTGMQVGNSLYVCFLGVCFFLIVYIAGWHVGCSEQIELP